MRGYKVLYTDKSKVRDSILQILVSIRPTAQSPRMVVVLFTVFLSPFFLLLPKVIVPGKDGKNYNYEAKAKEDS